MSNPNFGQRTRLLPTRFAAVLGAAALLVGVGGWVAFEPSAQPYSLRRPVGTLAPGFYDPAAPPPPEGTITPQPGSWSAVHPPRGFRVVLLTAGAEAPTITLVKAVQQWARAEHVRLNTVAVTKPSRFVDGIVEAIEHKTDLVIAAGHPLVDALALVTASFLDQHFLVLGAQLPEPTVNVTAVIWPGASSRGREIPDTLSFQPAAFTRERADAAIRAGVASVLHDLTGIVIRID
jgi:hypothetical protein